MGKSQPEVLLGCWRCKSSRWRMRNGVLDVQCNSAIRTGFRSIKLEETMPGRDSKESGTSCGRKNSVKQMMSGFSAAAWIAISIRLEQRLQMFLVHTVRDRGGGNGMVQDTVEAFWRSMVR